MVDGKSGDLDIENHIRELINAKEVGDRGREGCASFELGVGYFQRGDFRKAIEYGTQTLSIVKEMSDKFLERKACGLLGDAYNSLGDFDPAIEHLTKYLSIARELGDRPAEGKACCGIGSAYERIRKFEQAIEFFKLHLTIAKEVEDRDSEKCACRQLGNVYFQRGDFKQAIKYGTQTLSIAKEMSDKFLERNAYGLLGGAYNKLGDLEQTIEHYTKYLSIAQELGDRPAEGEACCDIGSAYERLRKFEQAIEFYKLHHTIAKEVEDRDGQACACRQLGDVYFSLGNFKQAIEHHTECLSIAKELGDRGSEEGTYNCLGDSYQQLGNFKQAIDYHAQSLRIAKEVGNKASELWAYLGLGYSFESLNNLKEATEFFIKGLNIAKEIGHRLGEGRAYCGLGSASINLGDFEQAMEYFKQQLSIAKELRNKKGEAGAHGNLGTIYRLMGNIEQAIECHELSVTISKESGDRLLEGKVYNELGDDYHRSGCFSEALECYRSSIEILESTRTLLQSEDAWKIGFRDLNSHPYTGLWRTLLMKGHTEEALCAAERGRAQALIDVLKTQYGVDSQPSASVEPKETISFILNNLSTPTVFVAWHCCSTNFWVLRKGSEILFEHIKTKPCGTVSLFMENTLAEIGAPGRVICENRSMDELSNDSRSKREDVEKTQESSTSSVNSLPRLYDVIIGPIADLLHGDQLIIVPDGPFCLAPYSALSESIRIRTVPSLTALKLIAGAPEDFHFKTGALVVGDPCLKEVTNQYGWEQLEFAREEAKMIGKLLNITPLIGSDATKDEVLKRLKSVALVHIAAHGCAETGEIVLAPKTDRTSQILERQDFILTMSDVQAVRLRARLVVLSCCHSGRGEVKSEGVVGIARAFLCAGARSVLVSLWAIDDEATLMFMRNFYQQLADGKRASVALHQAMKSLRESQKFGDVKYWAPFVLIGDDVTLEIGKQTDNGESSLRLNLEKSNFICK